MVLPVVRNGSQETVAQQLGFRLDIQGLRALAVVAVVAFHVGLPVAGFIGVDVFFVISGFVITNVLLREVEHHGRIRVWRFWSRRFIRLMPALSLLVVVVVVISALILLPPQQQIANATGISAMFFVANVFIARNTGGYFDPPADSNPLLNTWSLSVEEQFYFLFPVLILIAVLAKNFWNRRGRILAVVVIVTGLSFALMVLRHSGSLNVTWLNFYDPIQRAWEFGVGSLFALVPLRYLAGKRWLGVFLSLLGVGLLIAALVILKDPESYPGPLALLPVTATVCLIAAGSTGSNVWGAALSSRPLVMIGDASYSIYLWHWPAVSFAVLLGAESSWVLMAAVLVAMVPAWVSYRFVETPLRVRMHDGKSVSWLIPGVTWVAPVMAVLLVVFTPKPTTGLEGTSGVDYLTFIQGNSSTCEFTTVVVPGTRCRQSIQGVNPEVVVIGDSHGEHLFPGLISETPEKPSAYIYLEDWPSIVSADSVAVVDSVARRESVEVVLVSARWNGVNVESPQLVQTIKTLRQAGKKVVLLDDVPYFEFHAMECEFVRLVGPRPRCDMSRSNYQELRNGYVAQLELIAGETDAELLSVGEVFCSLDRCSMVNGDVLQYADNGHVNVQGSRTLIKEILQTQSGSDRRID